MNIRELISVPENRKGAAGILAGVIILFVIILFVRSCRRPDAETVRAYLDRLGDPVAERRMDALLGLARLNASGAASRVEQHLHHDPDERVRRAAAYAMIVLERPRFLELLRHDDESIRLLAIETIARREKEQAVAYLEKGLEDDSLEVRQVSMELLDRFGGRRALRIILEAAEKTGEDKSLRIAAIRILARSADRRLLGGLQHLAREDDSPDIRNAAAEAVRAIERQSRGG